MTTIIVSGHGHFATGIKSMLDLVLGEVEELYFVDFSSDLSSTDLYQKFEQIYNKHNGDVVFCVDIVGGTPFNQAAMLLSNNNKSTGVIGGMNIPMLLGIIDAREETADINNICELGKESAITNIKIFTTYSEEESLDNDGI